MPPNATHFSLRPGEVVRTPSILTLRYAGPWIVGNNLLRRHLFDQRPRNAKPDGYVLASFGALVSPSQTACYNLSTMLRMIDLVQSNLRGVVDGFWTDAGWYQWADNHMARMQDMWTVNRNFGQRWVDPTLQCECGEDYIDSELRGTALPLCTNSSSRCVGDGRGSLKPLSDAAHAAGMVHMTWFEPERNGPSAPPHSLSDFNPMAREHPDWVLPWANTTQPMPSPDWHLLNYGHPAALAFMQQLISRRLEEYDIDIYRQDFNMPPWDSWQRNASGPDGREEPTRVGINEMKHVAGLYSYLDYLVEQRPSLLIDNCAGGGRRMDYEMMKRSVTFWRDDGSEVSDARDQSMSYGINLWIPTTGLGSQSVDETAFRIRMAGYGKDLLFPTQMCANTSAATPEFWSSLREQLERRKRLVPLFVAGDFYPLSLHSAEALCPGPVDPWRAFQFHARDGSRGIVQAFFTATAVQVYPVVAISSVAITLFGLQPTGVRTPAPRLPHANVMA